jgi:hypothetical protein
LANSTGQGIRSAITTRPNAMSIPPAAIKRRSPKELSSRDTMIV